MKRDRGRLNSRTRETRNIPSLMPSLAVLRVTRRMRSMHTMASTASWVVLAAGPPPAGLGRGRPAPAHGHASPFSLFHLCDPCVVDVQFHIQGGSKSTRRAPDRRAYKYGTYSSRDPCDPIPPHLPRAPHLFCFVSCHGSPRCFQTGIPVSTRLINRHGVTMKSRSFPQLCVCSHTSETNSESRSNAGVSVSAA